jgi:hypothetical protein
MRLRTSTDSLRVGKPAFNTLPASWLVLCRISRESFKQKEYLQFRVWYFDCDVCTRVYRNFIHWSGEGASIHVSGEGAGILFADRVRGTTGSHVHPSVVVPKKEKYNKKWTIWMYWTFSNFPEFWCKASQSSTALLPNLTLNYWPFSVLKLHKRRSLLQRQE